MSLEALAGVAAAQERLRKAMTGSDAIANMLHMQERIEKATAPYKKFSQLAPVSEAIVGNHRKLKNFGVPDLLSMIGTNIKLNNDWIANIHSIAANAGRIQANWTKLIGSAPLADMAKQHSIAIGMLTAQRAAIFNNDFISSMQAIAVSAEKAKHYWQKIVDESPMLRMAREFRQPDYLKTFLNPAILRSLEPGIAEELNTQTGQAVVLAENLSAKDHASKQDIEEFREFVRSSFAALAELFKKAQRSPMAVIGFWSGIIGLLWGILYPLTQAEPATKKQAETLLQENHELRSEMNELRQDVKEMRGIIDRCLLDTIRDITESRHMRCKLSLRLKPKTNSLFICNLQADQEVSIITTNHKWVYVTVLDADNLPVGGWMLKKYLR